MPFVVTSEREVAGPPYEKVGRLIAAEDGYIRCIRDGTGEVFRVHTADIMLCLAGLSSGGIRMSESGRRVLFSGQDGGVYWVFTRQVRGMLEQWGKKKAAMFVMRREG